MKVRLGSSRGSGLVMGLIATSCFGLLGVVVYQVTRSQVRLGVYQMRLTQAHYIAEAGLEDAYRELHGFIGWRTGFKNKPFAGGSYTVTLSTDAVPWITSTGYSKPIPFIGPAVKTVRARASVVWGRPKPGDGLIAESMFKVDGLLDAYDSSVSLDPASFSFGCHLWSNGQIVTKEGTGIRIRGNAYYAFGAGPKPETVEGPVILSTQPVYIPFENGAAYMTANNNATGISPSSAYKAGSMTLEVLAGQTATILPGIYYLKGVKITGTLIAETTSGTITIYLDGDHVVDTPGEIRNTSKLASRLNIYGQTQPRKITIASQNALHAKIAAGGFTVDVAGSLYGQVSARSINITDTGRIHFDSALTGPLGAEAIATEPGTWSASYVRQ